MTNEMLHNDEKFKVVSSKDQRCKSAIWTWLLLTVKQIYEITRLCVDSFRVKSSETSIHWMKAYYFFEYVLILIDMDLN